MTEPPAPLAGQRLPGEATADRKGIGLAVSFRGVSKSYGATPAVSDISLDVQAGEFLALLGPSGSGKSTLLMVLAGFERPTSGRVLVGGRDLTDLPANRREIGMVFQRYALFPHMTAAQNIDFPLRMRARPAAERRIRVARALAMVELEGFAERLPSQLSGGQQQRVALARALVFDPPVLLMDEPLGALDRKLRRQMQLELAQLKDRLGATIIYVTHDQEEALAMADRVAILRQGRIEQVDAPRALYESPRTAFVASFMGELNQLDGTVLATGPTSLTVQIEGSVMPAASPAGATPIEVGARVVVGLRPEHALVRKVTTPGAEGLSGRVIRSSFGGATMSVFLELKSGEGLQAALRLDDDAATLKDGDAVVVSWRASDAIAFAAADAAT